MKEEEVYKIAYQIMDDSTPMPKDCGSLCGTACCKGDDETGMYLFPFEDRMYIGKRDGWFNVFESDFEYQKGKNAMIFTCNENCNRKIRPLACRIFPLTPYINSLGKLSVVMNPLAKSMCPLAEYLTISELQPQFVRRVTALSNFLVHFKVIRQFIVESSQSIDEHNQFLI